MICVGIDVLFSRPVAVLFPELEKLVLSLHMVSVYAPLSALPSASKIASSIGHT